MKTKLTLAFFLSIFLMMAGCKKDNQQPGNGNGSTVVTTGTVYFKNSQSDPYKIYIDNVYQFTVSAGATSSAYTVTGGVTYQIKAEQASGYTFYPTVYTGSVNVGSGGTTTWTF